MPNESPAPANPGAISPLAMQTALTTAFAALAAALISDEKLAKAVGLFAPAVSFVIIWYATRIGKDAEIDDQASDTPLVRRAKNALSEIRQRLAVEDKSSPGYANLQRQEAELSEAIHKDYLRLFEVVPSSATTASPPSPPVLNPNTP